MEDFPTEHQIIGRFLLDALITYNIHIYFGLTIQQLQSQNATIEFVRQFGYSNSVGKTSCAGLEGDVESNGRSCLIIYIVYFFP